MNGLEAIHDPEDILSTAADWAHDQGDYTPTELADGSAYRCELEMMRDEWSDRFANIDGALALLDERIADGTLGKFDGGMPMPRELPESVTQGLTRGQRDLLTSHGQDSIKLAELMAQRMRKVNRQELQLVRTATPAEIQARLDQLGR